MNATGSDPVGSECVSCLVPDWVSNDEVGFGIIES